MPALPSVTPTGAESPPLIFWAGSPRPSAYVWRRLWPALPAALLTLAVGVTWEYLAITGHHLIVYPLLGWPLPLLGLCGAVVYPLRLWSTARRMRYEVSAAGVRVAWGRRAHQSYELAPAAVPPARLVSARGGDDVWFDGPPPRVSHWGWWQTADDRPVLSSLADAHAALAAVAQLRERAGSAGDWALAAFTPVQPGYYPPEQALI
jgi:hypothetical protein